MKKILLFAIMAIVLVSCNTSEPTNTTSNTSGYKLLFDGGSPYLDWYTGIWGTLLQILLSEALCNISFHCAHDKMALREKWKSVQEEDLKSYDRQKKIGNRINFSLFCPACRDTSILIPLVR